MQVISGRTSKVVATVHVGFTPAGVAVNPRTNKIYVTFDNIAASLPTTRSW